MESGDNVSEGYRDLNVLIIFCTLSEDNFFGKTSDQPESVCTPPAEGALDDVTPGADKAWHSRHNMRTRAVIKAEEGSAGKTRFSEIKLLKSSRDVATKPNSAGVNSNMGACMHSGI